MGGMNQALLERLNSFLEKCYLPWKLSEDQSLGGPKMCARPLVCASISPDAHMRLQERIRQRDISFNKALLQLIDQKGMTDAECYKRAGIDRRLFSKIRSQEDYHCGKTIVLSFAIALELTLGETKELLEKSGYALSRSDMRDVIVEFFILEGIYDIMTINEVLDDYEIGLLGSSKTS